MDKAQREARISLEFQNIGNALDKLEEKQRKHQKRAKEMTDVDNTPGGVALDLVTGMPIQASLKNLENISESKAVKKWPSKI